MMDIEEIASEAALLDEKSRASLASRILKSLSPSNYDVSDEEVLKRSHELESGEVEDISFEELKRRIGR